MKSVNPIREIKKIEDIKKLLENKRNELLFIMGINSALRVSDLLRLTIGDVIDEDGNLKDAVTLKEKKTDKTKEFILNKSVKQALSVYLEDRKANKQPIASDSPLFLSRKSYKAINRGQAWQILHDIGQRVGLEKIAPHSLRKTFGYQVYKKSGHNIGLVQKLLNHSSSADTLRYIGIEQEELNAAYLELNL